MSRKTQISKNHAHEVYPFYTNTKQSLNINNIYNTASGVIVVLIYIINSYLMDVRNRIESSS